MKRVCEFLKEINFTQTWEEMDIVEKNFIRDMEKGLKGEEGSLPMLPTYLSVSTLPMKNHDIIVMDAGGTNLRVALLHIVPGQKPEILYHHKQSVPGKSGPISPEQFFDELAKALLPVACKSDRIGFCFSFPCNIQPDLDGEILCLDKELDVPAIGGTYAGKALKAALKRLGAPHEHKIVVLNDTVATLLGALAEHPADCYSGYIGMILGTGANCCYSECNQRITKIEKLSKTPGSSIINMESGSFNGFAMTKADILVSAASAVPEQNLLEKTMSGEYQGKVMDALLICAAEAGCFSSECARHMKTQPLGLTAADISQYLALPHHVGRLHDLAPVGEDAQTLYILADALSERAAMMAVMNLTAIMDYTQTGLDPLLPVCVAIEGTTYMKNRIFRQKIQSHLIHYTQRARGYHCRVISTDEANLVGSAVAAMMI